MKMPLEGSQSQMSAKLSPAVVCPPKMTNLLRSESNTMLAPARGLGPTPAEVRLVHVPVAGSHSHSSWESVRVEEGYAHDRPLDMTRTLRTSSKAADCR